MHAEPSRRERSPGVVRARRSAQPAGDVPSWDGAAGGRAPQAARVPRHLFKASRNPGMADRVDPRVSYQAVMADADPDDLVDLTLTLAIATFVRELPDDALTAGQRRLRAANWVLSTQP